MLNVLVINLSGDNDTIIKGFANLRDATEYARRRVRSSVEELRKSSQKQDDLRTLWLIYGQDAIVLIENGYKGSNEIGYFIDNPASNLEKDYQSIEPK